MKAILLKYTSLFMALYLLNCSVDAPDAFRGNATENLKYNEQESIVELIVEKALGFENAIPEYDDTDSENETTTKKNFATDYFVLPPTALTFIKNFVPHILPEAWYKSSFSDCFIGTVSPPPEV